LEWRVKEMSGLLVVAACIVILFIAISMEENSIKNGNNNWRRIAALIENLALIGIAIGFVIVVINDLVHLF